MKLLKVIVDKKPTTITDCIFLKVGLCRHKCKLLNKNIHEVCFTSKCPLEQIDKIKEKNNEKCTY